MEKRVSWILVTLLLVSSSAFSRNTQHFFSIQEAMASAEFKQKLDPSIHFYFANQKHPKIMKSAGSFVSNKKTNAFNKTDEQACKHVLLSALLSFQQRAKQSGANAVVNIQSFYDKNAYSSSSKYECHAGSFIAGVALKADVVTIEK